MAIAFYARKSVERENSISCETQLSYCEAMLKPDEKREEILTFIDNGYSGGNTQREGFQKMMCEVQRGHIRKIIVYRLDRISRSLADFVGILETLKKNQVQFVSSRESFDTSSPYGEMIVKILMIFAEFERQSIIERVTQAYAHRSEKGFYMGGRRPYGYTFTDTTIGGVPTKMLTAEKTEILQIQCIFDTYAVTGVSLRKVIDTLVSQGMLPTEGHWTTAKLSTILKNPIYVRADNAIYAYFSRHHANILSEICEFDGIHGIQLYGQSRHTAEDWSDIKVLVMKHKGIIPSDIWLACQEKLEKNRQIGNTLSNQTSWLSGILRCKSCGKTMTVTKGGRHADGSQTRYFRCIGKSEGSCSGSEAVLYAESLEDMIYASILEKLTILSGYPIGMERQRLSEINPLKNQLSEIRTSQEKLVSLLMNDALDAEMIALLNEKARILSENAREIEEKILQWNESVYQNSKRVDFTKFWISADYDQRKAVCKLLIDAVYIHLDGTAEVLWNL